MRKITIDCTGIETPRQLHRAFADALSFPEWYGNNLDALHDLLCAICEETEITLLSFSSLPRFSFGFRAVLNDAEEEKSCLYIHIQ